MYANNYFILGVPFRTLVDVLDVMLFDVGRYGAMSDVTLCDVGCYTAICYAVRYVVE